LLEGAELVVKLEDSFAAEDEDGEDEDEGEEEEKEEEEEDERKETVFWVSKSIVPECSLLATKQVSSCTKSSAFISCSGFKTVSF